MTPQDNGRSRGRALISNVLQGKPFRQALSEVVPAQPRYRPSATPVQEVQHHPRMNTEAPARQIMLGYLRPPDQFMFTAGSQLDGIRVDIDYTIVPAERGFVSFTGPDTADTHTFPLEDTLASPVKLLNVASGRYGHRIYQGDRVQHRRSLRSGLVIDVSGSGCAVRFDDAPQDPLTLSPGVLVRIEKDATTRSYVKRADGTWIVTVGEAVSRHETHLDAVRFLATMYRPAFCRYSRWLSTTQSQDGPLDPRLLRYLVRVDPSVWETASALRTHGILIGAMTVVQAIERLDAILAGHDVTGQW